MDIRLNYTASKTPIAAPYSRREWISRYPAWELNRIFFISGVDNLDILKRMHELVCESEEDGLSPSEFVRRCLIMLDEQSKHIPQKVLTLSQKMCYFTRAITPPCAQPTAGQLWGQEACTAKSSSTRKRI